MTTTAHETAAAYWAAIDGRDWAALGALLAEDVVYDLPQPRQRIRGREPYLEFNREYPDIWTIVAVERVLGEGDRAATWTRFLVEGTEQSALTFLDLDPTGMIATITEFWPEAYEPPAGREHLAERY